MLILKIYSIIMMTITLVLNIRINMKEDRLLETYISMAIFMPILIYILIN